MKSAPINKKARINRREHRPLAAVILSTVLALGIPLLVGCDSKDDAAAGQAKAREHLERAESYRHQGQFRAAIIEARNALQQSPQDRASLLKLATLFNDLGQGKSALKLLEPVLDKDPTRDEVLVAAQAYYLQRKYQTALDYLARNEPRVGLADNADANLIRARAHMKLGNLDNAQAALAKLNAGDVQVALEQSRLQQLRGETAAAQEAVRGLLQKHPDNVDVLSEAALYAERNSKLDEAEDLLSRALINLPSTDILVPKKAEVLQRLVTLLTKLGRSNEALIYAKTLSDANPQGAELQDKFKQGLELFQEGKLDEAEKLLTEVYNDSKNDSTGALLGMIRYAKNDLKGAASYLSANLDPEVAPEAALTTLAVTQLRLSQPEKLLELFDEPARGRIENPGLKALVGIALLQTGQTAEGEKLVREAQAAAPDNNVMQVTIARHYLISGQYQRAIESLQGAIEARPDPALSRLLIAAYAGAKKNDEALATAQQLAKSDSDKAESWWVLGRTALQLQNLELANSSLREALKRDANFLPAQLDLAQLHILRKQPDQAAALYKSILAREKNAISALKGMLMVFVQKGGDIEQQMLAVSKSDNARAVLGEYYLRRQQFDDAERVLKVIAAGDGQSYADQLKQAFALASAGRALQDRDYATARTRIVEGLKVNPRNPELLILLARLEQADNRPMEAKKIGAQLSLQAPDHPGLQELQGDFAMLDKQPKVASEHYRKAWTRVPNNGLAMKLYQSLSEDAGAAKTFLAEWKKRLPDSDRPWLLEGIELQRGGDNKGALAAYDTVLQRNPKNIEALNNAAWLYGEMKDARGIAMAEQAAQLAPENPAVLDTYGWLLVQNNQREKGIEVLERAAALAPKATEIQDHLKQARAMP